MSDALLFVFGLIVTVVAIGAVGTIWWAAFRDGRVDERLAEGKPTDFSSQPR